MAVRNQQFTDHPYWMQRILLYALCPSLIFSAAKKLAPTVQCEGNCWLWPSIEAEEGPCWCNWVGPVGQVPRMSQAESFLYPGASPPRSPWSPLLNPQQTAVRAKSQPLPFIMDLGINEDCSQVTHPALLSPTCFLTKSTKEQTELGLWFKIEKSSLSQRLYLQIYILYLYSILKPKTYSNATLKSRNAKAKGLWHC